VGAFTMSDLLRFAGVAGLPPVPGAVRQVFLPLVRDEE
jgi:hypothetical protein